MELVTMARSRSRRPGFTLIELLIVVVIIGILASIAVVRTRTVQRSAYESTLKTDLNMLAKHEELFHYQYLRYASLDELVNYSSSEGVSVSLDWLADNGFAATASHSALPTTVCAYFVGAAPEDARGPAVQEGEVRCE